MKQKLYLSIVVLLLLAGIAVSQLRKPAVQASPEAMLYLIGDTEHELTRMPAVFTRISDAQEVAIGDRLSAYVSDASKSDKADVRAIQQYVSQVGSRVAEHAHRKLPYKFHFEPDRSFVNAYALPGGHVVIGAGLIELMDSEDELASVLGHEIEHIDHYHCAERVQTEEALRKLPLASLAALPVEVFQAGYSKTDELEADREGVRLAALAGYSPEGAIRLFEKFGRLYREVHASNSNPEQELSQVLIDGLSGYFRSHPLPEERIQQVQTMIASEHLMAEKQEKPLAVEYIFDAGKAQDKLDANKYEQAVSLSTSALSLNPSYVSARKIRARSEFLLAHFSDAATDYGDLVASWQDMWTVDCYADALAAANRSSAAAEFQHGLAKVHAPSEVELEVQADSAGLELLAGSQLREEQLAKKAQQSRDGDVLARLGKWNYRAGRFARAEQLLEAAVEARPSNVEYQTDLAWVLLEEGKYASSIDRSNAGNGAESLMSRAVARWQAHDQNAALTDFNSGVIQAPYWQNPEWTRALYSDTAVQSIKQMQAESEKRRLAALRRH